MPFLHSLFPCFAGGEDQQQAQHPEPISKRKEATPRTSSNTSAYAAPIPVSEAPNKQQAPVYGRPPNTDKKLPPHPGGDTADSTAIELPGSSPNLHEMPATHIPVSHPLARPSNATSSDLPRPSQQSEQPPHSPYSTHSHPVQPASPSTSSYQPTMSHQGSIRAPSERGSDPDEISHVPTNNHSSSPYHPRGAAPNMYANVADALTDRKRMFERLRKANGVEGQEGAVNGGVQQAFAGYAAPVEMEAPVHVSQQQEVQVQQSPSEMAAREHVRNPSGPRELE